MSLPVAELIGTVPTKQGNLKQPPPASLLPLGQSLVVLPAYADPPSVTPDLSIAKRTVPARTRAPKKAPPPKKTPVARGRPPLNRKQAPKPVPSKVAKLPTAPVTYYSFLLTGDLPEHHCVGDSEAQGFLSEAGELVLKTFTYKTKTGWERAQVARAKHLRTHGKSVPSAPVPPSNADEAEARMVVEALEDVRECDRLQAYWKTNPHATQVAVVLTLLNRSNGTHWVWRPQLMVHVLKKFVLGTTTTLDPVLIEAFANLTAVHRPDPKDKTLPMQESFTPQGQTKPIMLSQYTSLTYISIPLDVATSIQAETTWIQAKCAAILEHIRTLLGKHSFRLVMQQMRSEFTDKIYNPNRGTNNLPGFLEHAILRISPFQHGTDHVIKEVSDEIAQTLFKTRLRCCKYLPRPHTPVMTDDGHDEAFPAANDSGDDDEPIDDEDPSEPEADDDLNDE